MNEIELREKCDYCYGDGGFYDHVIHSFKECRLCKGTGLVDWSKVETLELEEKHEQQ